MANRDSDESVLARIQRLVHEEQNLWDRSDLSDHDRSHLENIRVELDQYWDLLRQRRALREFGEDPNKARIRPPSVVEKYEQ